MYDTGSVSVVVCKAWGSDWVLTKPEAHQVQLITSSEVYGGVWPLSCVLQRQPPSIINKSSPSSSLSSLSSTPASTGLRPESPTLDSRLSTLDTPRDTSPTGLFPQTRRSAPTQSTVIIPSIIISGPDGRAMCSGTQRLMMSGWGKA